MSERKRLHQQQQGQAILEFILALVLFFGFLVFYIQFAVSQAIANYIQYATFMSARAYQSASVQQSDQKSRAERVAGRMLGRGRSRFGSFVRSQGGEGEIPGLELDPGEGYSRTNFATSWLEGVRYAFQIKVSFPPLSNGRSGSSIPLKSESWLGREASFQECLRDMEEIFGSPDYLIDNGC